MLLLLTAIFLIDPPRAIACEISVSKNGSIRSVQKAIDSIPEYNKERCVIRVSKGTYVEQVRVPSNKPYISLIGESADTTKISFSLSNKEAGSTSAAYAVYIGGHDFRAQNITFENSFGTGSQAVAVLVEADRAVFYKCRFLGWQDTLYAKNGRQYYKDVYIEGHVDYIFGQAAAVFEKSLIHSKGDGYITAPMRFSATENSGFVFIDCRLTSENTSRGIYLGRPWRDFGRTVFINTQMDADIRSEGWHHWQPHRENTAFFGEINSTGSGASDKGRVPWAKLLDPTDAVKFSPEVFLKGKDGWNPKIESDDKWAYRNRPDFELVRWEDVLDQPDEWYAVDEATRIANQVISYQRNNGGWPKNIDMAAMLTQKEREALLSSKKLNDTTIDNGATTKQLAFLAKVIMAKDIAEHKESFFKGLDFLFSMQYPNGGFPQFFPLRKDYSRFITYNDNAMTSVLRLFRQIRDRKSDYVFVDEHRRQKAAISFKKGVDLTLRLQVEINGKKTIWAAQYDNETLLPAPARSFEPVSLTSIESLGIVRLLMLDSKPTADMRVAIDSAAEWFEKNKIVGFRWIKDRNDSRIEKDAAAGPLWARFYELRSMRPIFIGRDGVIKYDVSEIEEERRNGYAWYTDGGEKFLRVEYPRWREKVQEKE